MSPLEKFLEAYERQCWEHMELQRELRKGLADLRKDPQIISIIALHHGAKQLYLLAVRDGFDVEPPPTIDIEALYITDIKIK